MRLLKFAVYLVVGYLIGFWLAPDLFSSDLGQTHWRSIWTYAWILCWPIGLTFTLFLTVLPVLGQMIGYTLTAIALVLVIGWFFSRRGHNTPNSIL